jgi:hypothetical protein
MLWMPKGQPAQRMIGGGAALVSRLCGCGTRSIMTFRMVNVEHVKLSKRNRLGAFILDLVERQCSDQPGRRKGSLPDYSSIELSR